MNEKIEKNEREGLAENLDIFPSPSLDLFDLEKYYLSKSPSQSEIKEIYENNKDMFTEEFKSFVYAEVNPQNLTGKSVYDENFYRNLDILENKLLA